MWNRLGLSVRLCYSKAETVHEVLKRADTKVETTEGLSALKDAIKAAKSTGSLSELPKMGQYQFFSRSLMGNFPTAPIDTAVECLQYCANYRFTHDPDLISSALKRCASSPRDLSQRNLLTALLACEALREIPEVAEGLSSLITEASRRLSSGGCGNLSPIPLAITDMALAMGALVTYRNYSQRFFDLLSDKFLMREEEKKCGLLYIPQMLSSLSWCLARARHYRPDVMDCIADLSLNHLNDFNSQDLGRLAYAFGFLNHPRRDLLVAIADRFTCDLELRRNHLAHINIMWACIVADMYPKRLMRHSISRMLQASSRPRPKSPNLQMSNISIQFLQLHVALTHEHPELGLGTLPPELVQGFLGAIYEDVLSVKAISKFQRNMWRALERVVGGWRHYIPEALTRSGYAVDAELLLGPGNTPLLVPRHWYFRTISYVRNIALRRLISSSSGGGEGLPRQESLLTLEAKGKEEDGGRTEGVEGRRTEGEEGGSKDLSKILSGMSVIQRHKLINLASDWHSTTTAHSAQVARRVAIEADGPLHFAANCNHHLGRTVLKHRQLRAMGWDVISIPYYEWAGLETGDCHVQYLKEKLSM